MTAAPGALAARPPAGRMRLGAGMVGRQLWYEQLSFWRNPVGAAFTVGFSLVFLLLLAAAGGKGNIQVYHVKSVQYYAPSFAAYGVMSASFNMLAIALVNRRENGLLKRLRLSPLPAWAMLAAIVLNALVVSIVQVALLIGAGWAAFGLKVPGDPLPLVLVVVVGTLCLAPLGIAASTLVPNEEAAGPVLSIVFFVLLFVSGLWYPLQPHSTLARVSAYLPFRRLILATLRPFLAAAGLPVSVWSWSDLGVVALWGVGATLVAVRRFRFEPRRR